MTGAKCTATQLQDYVEGLTLDSGDQVVKSGSDYTITYKKLKDVNDKYAKLLNGSDSTDRTDTATQAVSAKAMGNKPEEPEKPANPANP